MLAITGEQVSEWQKNFVVLISVALDAAAISLSLANVDP
jgi:hypothetical protein